MTLEDRQILEVGLDEGDTFTNIGKRISKHPTALSKEVIKNSTIIRPSTFNKSGNTCIHRQTCDKATSTCMKLCSDYQKETCERLLKPPYVCNGCKKRNGCRKTKYIYKAKEADEQYRNVLSSSRQGINLTEEETNDLSNIVIPAIKKGHSPAMILMNNNNITICEKTIYNYVEQGIFKGIGNIDLPRKVKYKKRHKHSHKSENNNSCRIGRTYEDFNNYIAEHPNAHIVEMDTVEGIKGGKCLLTLLFRNCNFMIAFLLESKTKECVLEKLNYLKELWGERFIIDFEVILTDNGVEFLEADGIEKIDENNRIHLFYCDPGASWQKAKLEKNHEYIRYVLPKETSFDQLNDDDIILLMSHINSSPREELNCACPYDLALILIGQKILSLKYSKINGNDIILKPKLLKK